jgi:hypothetical protein
VRKPSFPALQKSKRPSLTIAQWKEPHLRVSRTWRLVAADILRSAAYASSETRIRQRKGRPKGPRSQRMQQPRRARPKIWKLHKRKRWRKQEDLSFEHELYEWPLSHGDPAGAWEDQKKYELKVPQRQRQLQWESRSGRASRITAKPLYYQSWPQQCTHWHVFWRPLCVPCNALARNCVALREAFISPGWNGASSPGFHRSVAQPRLRCQSSRADIL